MTQRAAGSCAKHRHRVYPLLLSVGLLGMDLEVFCPVDTDVEEIL